jgi:hypothetical protein
MSFDSWWEVTCREDSGHCITQITAVRNLNWSSCYIRSWKIYVSTLLVCDAELKDYIDVYPEIVAHFKDAESQDVSHWDAQICKPAFG